MSPLYAFLVASFVFVVTFQNCSPVNFEQKPPVPAPLTSVSSEDPTGSTVALGGVGTVDDTVTGNIVCDPFSPGTPCSLTKGLRGNVYYFNGNEPNLTSKNVDDYIKFGFRIDTTLIMNSFDIPTRSFSEGFPIEGGGYLVRGDGERLVEWFAIDVSGTVRATTANYYGDYQLGLAADDGAVLMLNNSVNIDNDHVHSTQWKCGTSKLTLGAGTATPIRLKYFQGPRTQIALQLMWRPYSQSGNTCGEGGGFVPVPKDVLFPN